MLTWQKLCQFYGVVSLVTAVLRDTAKRSTSHAENEDKRRYLVEKHAAHFRLNFVDVFVTRRVITVLVASKQTTSINKSINQVRRSMLSVCAGLI